jgi:hypothetical protein
MSTLELHLPEPTAEKLRLAAERLHMSPEDLLLVSLEEKLTQLDSRFENAGGYVLNKNSELYRRLGRI